MSILLKALKKSEAQRQVGQPPDIHAPVDLSETKTPSNRRWLPLIILSLTAIVLAWFGWQQYRPADELPTPQVVENAVETARDESGASEGSTERTETRARTGAEPIDISPPSTPKVVNFPSGEAAEDRVAGEARQDGEAEGRKQRLSRSFTQFESAQQRQAEDASAADSQEQTANTERDQEADISELESTAEALVRLAPEDRQTDPESRPRDSRTAAEQEIQTGDSEPISFWQLPQNMRDRLPEFRITVLVYAEAPEDRFVLVNGARLKEKDELDAGLILDEIRRDGVVFQYRDYRFLVKG